MSRGKPLPESGDEKEEQGDHRFGGDRSNRRSRGGEENKRRGRSSGRIVGAARGVREGKTKGENEKKKKP